MEFFLIPLQNVPQDFEITLKGRDLRLVTKWNESSGVGVWCLDIYDNQTQKPLVMNIPLVTGTNLLEQFEYLQIEGALYVSTEGENFKTPTLESLGLNSNLYFVTGE